jgi:hypothetical protein
MFDKINIKTLYQLVIIIFVVSVNIIYTNYKSVEVQKQYVLVDTNAISKRFLASVIRADLPDHTYKDLLQTFDVTLTKVINQASQKNGFIALKQNVVLTDIPDITLKIEELVWKGMGLDKLLFKQSAQ